MLQMFKVNNTHLLDVPLSLGRDDVVSSVLRRFHTAAADAGVVGATEELQTSQVDGTQRQVERSLTWATQSVPAAPRKANLSRCRCRIFVVLGVKQSYISRWHLYGCLNSSSFVFYALNTQTNPTSPL